MEKRKKTFLTSSFEPFVIIDLGIKNNVQIKWKKVRSDIWL